MAGSNSLEIDTTTEIARLRAAVRRLGIVAALALLVASGLAVFVAYRSLTPPTQIEVRDGGRAAVLTAESLRLELDGEPRVRLDTHSGLVVGDAAGNRVSVDPSGRVGVYRADELVAWANAEDGWASAAPR
jgi:hypothetical protein